jgi:endonuclease YncB( thermonuclease family)
MKRFAIVFMLLLLTVLFSCAPAGPEVNRVIDGDTIELAVGVRVRLYGVDTPERGQPGFAKATEFTKDFITHNRIKIEKMGTDKYGRVVAIVFGISRGSFGNKILNAELVKHGHAIVLDKYCKVGICDDWRALQK